MGRTSFAFYKHFDFANKTWDSAFKRTQQQLIQMVYVILSYEKNYFLHLYLHFSLISLFYKNLFYLKFTIPTCLSAAFVIKS